MSEAHLKILLLCLVAEKLNMYKLCNKLKLIMKA